MSKRLIRSLVLAAFMCCFLPQYSAAQIVYLCVDPGHGGIDPGAVTHYDDFHEDDINLMVAKALKDTLEWYGCVTGVDIIYTRLTDTTVEIDDRPDIANQKDAEAFISIHHNSAVICPAQRTEVLYSEILTCDNGPWQGWTRDTVAWDSAGGSYTWVATTPVGGTNKFRLSAFDMVDNESSVISNSFNVCASGDIDCDLLVGSGDNCPYDYNPLQEDADADGVGDVCDNCPTVFNPGQEDGGRGQLPRFLRQLSGSLQCTSERR